MRCACTWLNNGQIYCSYLAEGGLAFLVIVVWGYRKVQILKGASSCNECSWVGEKRSDDAIESGREGGMLRWEWKRYREGEGGRKGGRQRETQSR